MSPEKAAALKSDAKFILKMLKKSISVCRKDIRVLKRVTDSVKGISHNRNVNTN